MPEEKAESSSDFFQKGSSFSGYIICEHFFRLSPVHTSRKPLIDFADFPNHSGKPLACKYRM
jgi:hypothetical protein